MATETGRNRRFILTKNLIMMLVVLVVGLLAVWSWFTMNRTVTADNISIKAAYPNEIGLAKPVYNANGTDTGPGEFVDSISFSGAKLTKDCTGDGKTLIVPDFSVTKDRNAAIKKGREVNTAGVWEEAFSQRDQQSILNVDPEAKVETRYIEYEFYARSQNKDINLNAVSSLTTPGEATLTSGYSTNKESAYGAFSSDCIVGAVRVALLAQGASVSQSYTASGVTPYNLSFVNSNGDINERHLSCLWLPRPDLLLEADPNNSGSAKNWAVYRNIKNLAGYTTSHSGTFKTYEHTFYSPVNTDTENPIVNSGKWNSDSPSSYPISKQTGSIVEEKTAGEDEHFVVSANTFTNNTCPTLGQNVKVSDVGDDEQYLVKSTLRKTPTDSNTEVEYYVFKYTLRIWLEGTDPESRRAMDGGEFDLDLQFS